jgi:hypothetical protein
MNCKIYTKWPLLQEEHNENRIISIKIEYFMLSSMMMKISLYLQILSN